MGNEARVYKVRDDVEVCPKRFMDDPLKITKNEKWLPGRITEIVEFEGRDSRVLTVHYQCGEPGEESLQEETIMIDDKVDLRRIRPVDYVPKFTDSVVQGMKKEYKKAVRAGEKLAKRRAQLAKKRAKKLAEERRLDDKERCEKERQQE